MVNAIQQLSNLEGSLKHLLKVIDRKKDKIEKVIEEINKIRHEDKQRCGNCHSGNLRFNKDSLFCRTCGHTTKKEKKK